MLLKKVTALMTASVFTTSTYAMNMQEPSDSVSTQSNVSNSAVLQGQAMNLYTGDSLSMWIPEHTYQLTAVTLPSWNAGCGGIDLLAGGFPLINKGQFTTMLRNIDSNVLGYGLKLAIQNPCPIYDDVMQALQATMQAANRLNMDSCEAAKGAVNATASNIWTRSKQSATKNFDVDTDISKSITDARTNVMNSESRANQTVNSAASMRPEAKDQLPAGNVVWKAFKKLDGVTDEQRMILMSMIGSIVFPTGDTP